MSRVEADFECLKCGDIFTAVSGSMTKCRCGKSEVEPHKYSTSYKGENCFKRLDSRTYYFKSDYYILDHEEQNVWDQIVGFKFTNEQYDFSFPRLYTNELFDKSFDGDKFVRRLIASVEASNNMESTELCLNIDLDIKQSKEVIMDRMNRFLEILEKIKKKELVLADRSEMKELTGDWTKRQCELYDYTFYV